MADDELWRTLMRFHREIVVPDIERIVDDRVNTNINSLRNAMLANFDALWKRMDRLESEYAALNAAVTRLEERMAAVEERLAAHFGEWFAHDH